ncbi:MAG: hypothetical protein LWW85_03060 [Marinilabiliales bacterium]|nr:hypothetical protein [Marinilabiliales bacterium]
MKTIFKRNAGSEQNALQPHHFSLAGWLLLTALLAASCMTPVTAQHVSVGISINVPGWAPPYANIDRIRYYYFPDIETYFDARSGEFIYLDNGRWIFSRVLPPWYDWFDPNAAFVVALNYRVFEPWRHFRYYVSHYPRYYYRSVLPDRYRHHDGFPRGFNENDRNMVFGPRHERDDNGFRRPDNRPADRNRPQVVPQGPGPDRGREEHNNVAPNLNREPERRQPERQAETPRQMPNANREPARQENNRQAAPAGRSESVNYYGREVGKPVKVNRHMREKEETKTREEHTPRQR